MKIEFEVPDGEYCCDCGHQCDFEIEEERYGTYGNPKQYVSRTIVARCGLFNQRIHGVSLDVMVKCPACMEAAHE
jgi:hypothetical protein